MKVGDLVKFKDHRGVHVIFVRFLSTYPTSRIGVGRGIYLDEITGFHQQTFSKWSALT